MQRILFTPWSIAFALSCALHAGMLYSVTFQKSDYSFTDQLRSIEVSLVAALPQPKISAPPPQKKLRSRPVQADQVLPQQLPVQESVADVSSAEPDMPISETPAPVMQEPRFNAAYLNNPPPTYPLAARRRNIEGKVLVRAQVQADGSCSHAELKTPSASELLNQAALEAVKKWRFVPATLGGQTLAAWVEIPITFKLNN